MHNEIKIKAANRTHFVVNKIANSKALSKATREKCYCWSLGRIKDGVEEELAKNLFKCRKKKKHGFRKTLKMKEIFDGKAKPLVCGDYKLTGTLFEIYRLRIFSPGLKGKGDQVVQGSGAHAFLGHIISRGSILIVIKQRKTAHSIFIVGRGPKRSVILA